MAIDRVRRVSVTHNTPTNTTNPIRRTSLELKSVESREKSKERRMTAAKSPIDAPANTSWPSCDSLCPPSFSTGITRPSDVDVRITAASSGDLTRPAASNATPATSASTSDTAKPAPAILSSRPRNWSRSISRPARKRRNARPMMDRTRTGSSADAQPSTSGPTTMPRAISTTTAGICSRGTSPSASGVTNATAMTMARLPNETCSGTAKEV